MPGTRVGARRFSGWRIAVLSTITLTLTGPGQTIGVAVFIDHFVADLDLHRSTVSTAYLIGTLIGAATLPRVGVAVDRAGVRRAMTVIAVLFSIAVTAMAGVQGFVTLTIGFTFIRMLGQSALTLVSTVAVSLWFERRRGLVVGVTATVSSALMALVPVIMNVAIDAWSWRTTWLLAGASVALVVIPIARFGMIDRPSAVGQFVDGIEPDPSDPPPGSDANAGEGWGVDRATAMHTRAFWILAAMSGAMSMLVTAVNFHQIALLGEAGLSSTRAAAMFLPQVLGTAVAGIVAGAMFDRYSTRVVPSVIMAMMTVTLLMAGWVSGTRSVIAYAIVLGLTSGVLRTALSTIVPGWYGTAHLGSIHGALGVVASGSSALGPVVLSVLASSVGSLRTAAAVTAVIPLVIGMWGLTNRVPDLRSERPATPR